MCVCVCVHVPVPVPVPVPTYSVCVSLYVCVRWVLDVWCVVCVINSFDFLIF